MKVYGIWHQVSAHWCKNSDGIYIEYFSKTLAQLHANDLGEYYIAKEIRYA